MTPAARIEAIRAQWGRRLFILGHHYQQPDVLQHADAIGDSLELARAAAANRTAERIAFCGVRFMAETAEILTAPEQEVYMPDTTAGCPMADMVDEFRAQAAWTALQAGGADWAPVVYVNSSAEVKAFCGRQGGACCTSGNAAQVFQWAFAAGRRIFFLPDEHLGRNTAAELGLADEAVACYDPTLPQGGLTPAQLSTARVVVWKGFCHVHTRFEVDQVKLARARFPEARIIVHPETPREALVLCDASGSTSRIIRYVAEAPPGSTILIGTELHLVQRLATEYADRLTIHPLWPSTCWNMAKTTVESLAALLEAWPPQRRIRVRLDTAEEARGALDRMLAC